MVYILVGVAYDFFKIATADGCDPLNSQVDSLGQYSGYIYSEQSKPFRGSLYLYQLPP